MQYWAKSDGDQLADEMGKKIESFDRYIESIGRLERIKRSWEYVYGLTEGAYGLRKTGKVGEIIKISVNNYRAFANNIHVLLTQAKSHFECQAENMDFKSQAETILGKAIVDYYTDEAGIGSDFSLSALDMLIFAEVFMEVDWDEGKGDQIAIDPETRSPVFKGDISTKRHNSLNVIRDTHLRSHKANKWYIVRDYVDKYELAATYPEHEEHILQQSSRKQSDYRGADSIYFKIRNQVDDGGDMIEIQRLYHAPTRVMPDGVEALVIGKKVIFKRTLAETYESMPLKRLAASDIEGTFLPYSPLWDLIPLCQASDHLMTAQVTNATNLAFTNIWSTDPNLKVSQLSSGMGLISSAQKPEALNLGSSSPELQRTMELIQGKSQFLTGINSVAAGQPEAVSNIKSGNGLALILSTAVQFQSILQERYAEFRSDVMTSVIETIQKNATLPMVISIAGKGKVRYTKTFKKDDIASVKRVKCIVSSPIMATIGGRMQIADNLAEKFPGQITMQAYVSVLQTGNLDHIEGESFDESMALLAENEAIASGKEVAVNILENHPLHIKNHLKNISSPEAKEDPELIERTTAHILKHLDEWTRLSNELPELLSIIGIPPLGGSMPPMGPDGQPVQGAAPTGDAGAPVPEIEPRLPSMPKLPGAAPEGVQASYEQVSEEPVNLQ